MDGNPHRVFAAASWVLAATAAGTPGWIVATGLIPATALSAGFSSPDIDNTPLWRKMLKYFPGKLDNKILGHRRLTHWWGWPAYLMHLLHQAGPTSMPTIVYWLLWAMLTGWVSHIVGDFVFGQGGRGTPKGVPLVLWFAHVGVGLKSGCEEKQDWRGRVRKESTFFAGDRWFAGLAALSSVALVVYNVRHPGAGWSV